MNTTLTPSVSPQTLAERVLQDDESLAWAGRPDLDAMIAGTRRLPPALLWPARLVVLAAFVVAIALAFGGDSGLFQAQGLVPTLGVGLQPMPLIVAIFIAFLGFDLWRSSRRYIEWASRRSYAVTNRRALVLEDGAVIESYEAGDIGVPERRPRRLAGGHVDIVWGRRVRIGGRESRGRNLVAREMSLLGFKALAASDGERAMVALEGLREAKLEESAAAASPDEFETRGEWHEIRGHAHGCRLQVPASWTTQVRRTRVTFGRFGVEGPPHWHDQPDALPDWNVVRTTGSMGSYVELQVAKTKPKLTLDGMINSRAAKLVGMDEVLEQNAAATVGGVPGFYLTRQLPKGGAAPIVSGTTRDITDYLSRQYVLHDGTHQYYMVAVWPADAESEKAICVRIAESLRVG